MFRIIVILLLCFIVISLFTGLFNIMREGRDNKSNKAIRALTIRVGLSVLLFLFIVIASQFNLFSE